MLARHCLARPFGDSVGIAMHRNTDIMKRYSLILLVLIAASLGGTGCRTCAEPAAWEYNMQSTNLCDANAGTVKEEGYENPDTIASRIQKGDPDVVPVLRRWLAQESDRGTIGEATETVALSLQGLGAYRDTGSVDLVSYIYKKSRMGSALRHMAASTLASIGAKESLGDLKAITWDQQQILETRCRAAAALVELGEDLGREFLLLQYDLYRLERKTMHACSMDPVRATLEQMYDPGLVSALEKRIASETSTTMQSNIRTLIQRMAINAESVENLEKFAANTSWVEGRYRRYAAIEALGRKAGPDCIPLLESLRPWDGIDRNPDHIQQRYVKEFASRAIAAIRQHHWKHDETAEPMAGGDWKPAPKP
jgi:hypothetical protein